MKAWALGVAFVVMAISSVRAEECLAPDAWFPVTPKPTDAKPDPDSDCEFYQWAFQTFLYITQPTTGGDPAVPRFLSFKTPAELFGDEATPRFAKSDGRKVDGRSRLMLAPRVSKTFEPQSLGEILQAGSNGVLVDQAGRAVYYGLHINETFVNFIVNNGYTDMSRFETAPADQEFPRGSLELKSSWRVVQPGEDVSKYFTVSAEISTLVTRSDGQVVINPQVTRRETMALLGLHVVGVVDGHPEFIWATFEHDENVPNLSEGVAHNANVPVDAARDWTLYAKGTTAKNSNRRPGQSPLPPLRLVDPMTQVLDPRTSIFREFEFGGEEDPAEIISLNNDVKRKIATLAPSLAVWGNYSFRGALWMNNPAYFREGFDFVKADGDDPTKRILAGETKLSNSTMESFSQHDQSCFHCHDTSARRVPGTMETLPAKRLNVSHVLVQAYFNWRERKSTAAK